MICTVSIFRFPFTGMLVHHSVTPTLNSPVPTVYLYTWAKAREVMREQDILLQNTT